MHVDVRPHVIAHVRVQFKQCHFHHGHLRPKALELELMVVGRVFTLCLAAVSILWIPIINESQGKHQITARTSQIVKKCIVFARRRSPF